MKLAFKNRPTRQLACLGTFVLGMMIAPNLGIASDPVQQQPAPDQTVQSEQQDVQEFTKTVKKEFPINATGTVDLSNKYGKVDVHTWERDRVKIDVTIVVDARSESTAQEVFNRIQIDFSNDDSFVKAETSIETNKSWWGEVPKLNFRSTIMFICQQVVTWY